MFPCSGGWVGKGVVSVENDISGRESHYSEEISNSQKYVWGRISTFLMSGLTKWGLK